MLLDSAVIAGDLPTTKSVQGAPPLQMFQITPRNTKRWRDFFTKIDVNGIAANIIIVDELVDSEHFQDSSRHVIVF